MTADEMLKKLREKFPDWRLTRNRKGTALAVWGPSLNIKANKPVNERWFTFAALGLDGQWYQASDVMANGTSIFKDWIEEENA